MKAGSYEGWFLYGMVPMRVGSYRDLFLYGLVHMGLFL